MAEEELKQAETTESAKSDNKKTKTPSQLKKKYRAIQWGCFGGEFIATMIPFVTIGIVNYDKYFVQYNGTKMSIGFFLALGVMGIAIWGIAKKKLENSYITLILGWVVCAVIFTLMGEMITDLATIMWCGLGGLAGAYGLEIGSQKAKKKKDAIIDAEQQASKDNMVEQVKQEKETKKVKIKFKKK